MPMTMSASTSPPAILPSNSQSFNALPGHITTSFILPFLTSSDWLNFRVASRACYISVHGGIGDNVWQFVCPTCHQNPTHHPSMECKENDVIETTASAGIWKLALVREYQFDATAEDKLLYKSIHSPIEPVSEAFLSTKNLFTASNLFVSWMHWRKLQLRVISASGSRVLTSERLSGPYFLRAGSMWQRIEKWCDTDGVGNNFLPGQWINPFPKEDTTRYAKLLAFQAVYAFYAGQDSSETCMFGGYQIGIGDENMFEMTWDEPKLSKKHPHHIVVTKYHGGIKAILLDPASGQLYSFTDGKQLVATPCSGGTYGKIVNGIGIEYPLDPLDCKDSILRWFEEHANRLEQGHYKLGRLDDWYHCYECIVRYPPVPGASYCSRAVTRGIETVASAMYADEHNGFVISVSVRMLTPGVQEYMPCEQRGFKTCQLIAQYWKITSISPVRGLVEEIRCEGVNGYCPHLGEKGYSAPGDSRPYQQGDFKHQTVLEADESLTMEGYFQCIPGSITKPLGVAFNVRVAPFPLHLTPFLY